MAFQLPTSTVGATGRELYAPAAHRARTSRTSFPQEAAVARFSSENHGAEEEFPAPAHTSSVAPNPLICGTGSLSSGSENDEDSLRNSPASLGGEPSCASYGVPSTGIDLSRSRGSEDRNTADSEFITAQNTVKLSQRSVENRLDIKCKFFPAWFMIQPNGLVSGDLLVQQEEKDLQNAIAGSIADERGREGKSDLRVFSMAARVDVPMNKTARNSKGSKRKSSRAKKGPHSGAAERSAAFAELFEETQRKCANKSASKRHEKKRESMHNASFMRPT